MQLSVTQAKEIVLRPAGRLDASFGLELEHRLQALISAGQTVRLLVSLEALESIDSDGLMTLIEAFRLAQRHNQLLRFCAIPPELRIVFELTQLDRVFFAEDIEPQGLPLAA